MDGPEVRPEVLIRVNQQQVNAAGQRVGVNLPDLQFSKLNEVTGLLERFYIEWDTTSSGRGPNHSARPLANDPAGIILEFIVGR